MNPYGPPGSPGGQLPSTSDASRPGVTDNAIELLRQTRPWVRTLSVFAFIASGSMVIGALAMLAFSSASGTKRFPAAVGLIYLPMAALYIYPAIKLWTYGGAIARLEENRSPENLEAALAEQKSFWKFAGIVAIVMAVFYLLFIAATVVVGMLAA
ncbi:hypothetical protein AKJ09_08715 [Labilithrix luteola]|uniref:Uncharacterized protein n=1 Tax=Labilithrix luteola TaxID=1391654 RepID=A0A0K1Q8Q4_9BACT|nr:DUF5362 family protein [Labilithrix luteola]AKV02052.1 hypothetical protein AKJ09_08715 [Labilithrix luteola]